MKINKILGYLDTYDNFKAQALRNNLEYLKDHPSEKEYFVSREYNLVFKIRD